MMTTDTEASSSMIKKNRKSSIDTEPLTLSLAELHNAREAAIYVLSTKTWEEADDIFTRGLKPVEIWKQPYEEDMDEEEEEEEEEEMLYCMEEVVDWLHRRRSYINDEDKLLKSDLMTAPF